MLPLAVSQHVAIETVTKQRDRVAEKGVVMVDGADVHWLGISWE